MTFSTVTFFIFFTIVMGLMLLLKALKIDRLTKRKIQHIVLLAASFFFYGWWDWCFCFLMLFLISVSHFSALKIQKQPDRKIYLIIGVVVPLAVLGVFKYFNFFAETFAAAFGIRNEGSLKIILPVGISFYTFQSLSYTIDVYRKKLDAEGDFIKTALFIAFFPQLVAGPIVRASDFLPQLEEDRNISGENFKTGIQIFVFGLFKKAVIADWLSVLVDDVFRTPNAFHAISIIFAIIAYSIQIYFDFSGYSDMAIGSAKILGYDFKRNFNIPYISQNISEFWKRWHISLSSWLKEYLYIPLGGNRKGKVRTYLNNMITMLLGGLWHGADWTFVAWGCMHGLALCVHKFCKSADSGQKMKFTFLSFLFTITKILFTNIFVGTCWIFFRADSFAKAWLIISRIVLWKSGIIHIYIWTSIAMVITTIATTIAVRRASKEKAETIDGFYPVLDLAKTRNLVIFFTVTGIILGAAYTGENPFIYFQF